MNCWNGRSSPTRCAVDIAPITDGASVVVIAADDRARELRERPAWITGFEHRIETPVIRHGI